MATAKANQSAAQYLPPTINAKFKDRLPDIMNEIWRSMLVIEPEIDKMLVPINEFLDHLEYEIRKAELEVAQLEWKSCSVRALPSWTPSSIAAMANRMRSTVLPRSIPRTGAVSAPSAQTFPTSWSASRSSRRK